MWWICLTDVFLKVYQVEADRNDAPYADTVLPPLAENSPVQFVEWVRQEHTTKAPPRYGEASLVKAPETRGIGRPSTFASLAKLIKANSYVSLNKKRLVPTRQGLALRHFL